MTGRAVRVLGRLTLADGTVVATAFGIFVQAPHLFESMYYTLAD